MTCCYISRDVTSQLLPRVSWWFPFIIVAPPFLFPQRRTVLSSIHGGAALNILRCALTCPKHAMFTNAVATTTICLGTGGHLRSTWDLAETPRGNQIKRFNSKWELGTGFGVLLVSIPQTLDLFAFAKTNQTNLDLNSCFFKSRFTYHRDWGCLNPGNRITLRVSQWLVDAE